MGKAALLRLWQALRPMPRGMREPAKPPAPVDDDGPATLAAAMIEIRALRARLKAQERAIRAARRELGMTK